MKRIQIQILICIIILVISIAGCIPQENQSSTTDYIDISDISTPQQGYAVVYGKVNPLLSDDTEGIFVRLAAVHRIESGDGVFALDTTFSPITLTETDGFFIFKDIEPGEYVLVFGDPMAKYQIISEDDGSVKVWQVLPNEINHFGTINIEF